MYPDSRSSFSSLAMVTGLVGLRIGEIILLLGITRFFLFTDLSGDLLMIKYRDRNSTLLIRLTRERKRQKRLQVGEKIYKQQRKRKYNAAET